MALKKFGPNDLIVNTIRARPKFEFFIYDATVYYNNTPAISASHGAAGNNVLGVPAGYTSLYEYNIDRPRIDTDRIIDARKSRGSGPGTSPHPTDSGKGQSWQTAFDNNPHKYVLDTGQIYPFIIKDSSKQTFKTMPDDEFSSYNYGDIISGSTSAAYRIDYDSDPENPQFYGGGVGKAKRYQYPMSASITREFMTGAAGADATGAGQRQTCVDKNLLEMLIIKTFKCTPYHRHFWALKNRLDYYGTLSEHYKVNSLHGNKETKKINLISIPSIFFGSGIQPGSLSLKWYYTGSLAGELQDTKKNGELIEVSGSNVGAVAGVVMYNEGFVLLTGSWALNQQIVKMEPGQGADKPKWIYFGAGANDGINQSNTAAAFNKIAFNLSYRGTTETQTVTMFSHARKGEANFSNNPTYLQYGQRQVQKSSSLVYEENPNRSITNVVSSSYTAHSASFKRQVYISRVGIYDDNKNLIGVATLSNPILKEEDQDYSFKIRLDI